MYFWTDKDGPHSISFPVISFFHSILVTESVRPLWWPTPYPLSPPDCRVAETCRQAASMPPQKPQHLFAYPSLGRLFSLYAAQEFRKVNAPGNQQDGAESWKCSSLPPSKEEFWTAFYTVPPQSSQQEWAQEPAVTSNSTMRILLVFLLFFLTHHFWFLRSLPK